MKLRNFATAAAALSLVAAPVAAQERASAPASKTSEMGAAPSAPVILGVMAAIILGVVLLGGDDNDNDDTPVSA